MKQHLLLVLPSRTFADFQSRAQKWAEHSGLEPITLSLDWGNKKESQKQQEGRMQRTNYLENRDPQGSEFSVLHTISLQGIFCLYSMSHTISPLSMGFSRQKYWSSECMGYWIIRQKLTAKITEVSAGSWYSGDKNWCMNLWRGQWRPPNCYMRWGKAN